VKDLESAVFQKHQKLNIFEQLEKKIVEHECTRVMEDTKLQQNIDNVETHAKEIDFQIENMTKQMEQLYEYKVSLMSEFTKLKEQSEKSKEEIIEKLNQNYTEILSSYDELKKFQNEQEYQMNIQTTRVESNTNYIRDIQKRSDYLLTNLEKV
jgi:hypothetical protein